MQIILRTKQMWSLWLCLLTAFKPLTLHIKPTMNNFFHYIVRHLSNTMSWTYTVLSVEGSSAWKESTNGDPKTNPKPKPKNPKKETKFRVRFLGFALVVYSAGQKYRWLIFLVVPLLFSDITLERVCISTTGFARVNVYWYHVVTTRYCSLQNRTKG